MGANADKVRERLRDALDAVDAGLASTAALEAVREGMPVTTLYAEVLGPLMVETGERWQAGELPVWREHFVSATVRGVVERLASEVEAAAPPADRGTVVLACPPEEAHDLGLRMLADCFRLHGWRAVFLGADVPVEDIVGAVKATGAERLVLSGNTHFHRIRLAGLVEDLVEELPGIRIGLTGAAFAMDRQSDSWPDRVRLTTLRDLCEEEA